MQIPEMLRAINALIISYYVAPIAKFYRYGHAPNYKNKALRGALTNGTFFYLFDIIIDTFIKIKIYL